VLEQRGKQHHQERLAKALLEEIGALLAGELGDPRIGLASVTEVALAPGGKAARVFIHVEGTEEEGIATIDGLSAARGYMRHQIGERLGLRHVPELLFQLDRKEQYGQRIGELLQRSKRKKRK
jgi:ribosome-binding factor A